MGDVQAGAECTDVGVGERPKLAFPGLCHKADDGHGLNTDSTVGLVAFIVLMRVRIKPTAHKNSLTKRGALYNNSACIMEQQCTENHRTRRNKPNIAGSMPSGLELDL